MQKKYIGIAVVAVGALLSVLVIVSAGRQESTKQAEELHEAMYYRQLEDGKVQCELCPNRCILKEGQRGICNVRENRGGKLYSLVYGKPVTVAVDPIEKKPLYHFLPGSRALSLATAGCNLDCKYCQNWDIAHRAPEDVQSYSMTPQEVVEKALQENVEVIAFTYNEPTVWYEYMLDIAKLAQEKDLKTVSITAAYINPEPLKELLPYLDAVKVDLKSFNAETYRTLNQGQLQPVLESIKIVKESGTWLELVNLVVPGYTDSMDEIREMCTWIKDNLGSDVPLHFSRFWPKYKLTNVPPTPEETLIEARRICRDEVGLNYVYVGNVEVQNGGNTLCPGTEEPLITRNGYFIEENLISPQGTSSACLQTNIPGIWR